MAELNYKEILTEKVPLPMCMPVSYTHLTLPTSLSV